MAVLISNLAEFLCGYPLFFLLIGGGLYLFISSGAVPLRRLPDTVKILRERPQSGQGQISSVQALASVVAATIGLGNIAGVAIALVMGGPGAIFWMWVRAVVGMATKFHEGALAIMYRGKAPDGTPRGGTMHVIEQAGGRRWRFAAVFFAVAGMFGTLCIMNANQLTEALMTTFFSPGAVEGSLSLGSVAAVTGLSNAGVLRLIIGIGIALIVSLVIFGGITRIARVAAYMVPFMVGVYFLMVLYIILTHVHEVPGVFQRIFSEAFNLRAGFGAFAGIAVIGARRAALVNDAGIGTAGIMHGSSRNDSPVREGLVAMLGPAIDSGLVCTLTAVAILLCGDINVEGVKGLEVAMTAFRNAIPLGDYLLVFVVICFALSSMFSYSYYGSSCAGYLFGERGAGWFRYFFVATLVVFAIIPLDTAVALCDVFYALMAVPTMITVLALSSRVRAAMKVYFEKKTLDKNNTE